MTNRIHELMPEFARHEGRWTGTYTHITPTGEVLDHHAVHILAEFPNDGTADFRLNTHNVWGDGRSERAHVQAVVDNRFVFARACEVTSPPKEAVG